MKACIFFICVIACTSPAAELFPVKQYLFFSEALQKEVPYSVYIPSREPPEGGWPLLLILHGLGRNHRTLMEATQPETQQLIQSQKFVILFPNGEAGWWIDSPVNSQSNYQQMIHELLQIARRRFPVNSSPHKTGVWGWSMGGFGAVRFCEDYPELIRHIAVSIALVDFPNPALPPHQNFRIPVSVFGEDPDVWKKNNCLKKADKLRGKSLYLIAAGQAFDYQMNLNFKARLDALGIQYEYRCLDGGHTFQSVEASLPLVFRFMQDRFAMPEHD